MKPVVVQDVWDNAPEARLYYGIDVIEGLKLLPDASVHMVVTSPPYWRLRDYGVEGQIGLEETPDEYVGKLVDVFREAARVLRPDGTLWLNLGDSYSGGGGFSPNAPSNLSGSKQTTVGGNAKRLYQPGSCRPAQGLKSKDLVGIPWRVAFALQADGWYLRSDIVWAKNAVMPESVRDRPTRSHEFVFLLAHPESGGRYFYDHDAIREPFVDERQGRSGGERGRLPNRQSAGRSGFADPCGIDPSHNGGRNKRTVWTVNPKPYKGAHFAVWPTKLVEPMILAGTSEKGCCPICGAQWVRGVERVGRIPLNARRKHLSKSANDGTRRKLVGGTARSTLGAGVGGDVPSRQSVTVGWGPGCECGEEPVRPIVLDPFSGSATTGLVALQNGRDFIGIDLNAEYLPMAKARLLGENAPQEEAEGRTLIEELFGD